jgi:hypothetical protein
MSLGEKAADLSNKIDIGMFAFGLITGNPTLVVLSVASFGVGKAVESQLRDRRKQGKWVL